MAVRREVMIAGGWRNLRAGEVRCIGVLGVVMVESVGRFICEYGLVKGN